MLFNLTLCLLGFWHVRLPILSMIAQVYVQHQEEIQMPAIFQSAKNDMLIMWNVLRNIMVIIPEFVMLKQYELNSHL